MAADPPGQPLVQMADPPGKVLVQMAIGAVVLLVILSYGGAKLIAVSRAIDNAAIDEQKAQLLISSYRAEIESNEAAIEAAEANIDRLNAALLLTQLYPNKVANLKQSLQREPRLNSGVRILSVNDSLGVSANGDPEGQLALGVSFDKAAPGGQRSLSFTFGGAIDESQPSPAIAAVFSFEGVEVPIERKAIDCAKNTSTHAGDSSPRPLVTVTCSLDLTSNAMHAPEGVVKIDYSWPEYEGHVSNVWWLDPRDYGTDEIPDGVTVQFLRQDAAEHYVVMEYDRDRDRLVPVVEGQFSGEVRRSASGWTHSIEIKQSVSHPIVWGVIPSPESDHRTDLLAAEVTVADAREW